MFRIASILILTLALAAPAQAGFAEGVAAYQRDDYTTALPPQANRLTTRKSIPAPAQCFRWAVR